MKIFQRSFSSKRFSPSNFIQAFIQEFLPSNSSTTAAACNAFSRLRKILSNNSNSTSVNVNNFSLLHSWKLLVQRSNKNSSNFLLYSMLYGENFHNHHGEHFQHLVLLHCSSLKTFKAPGARESLKHNEIKKKVFAEKSSQNLLKIFVPPQSSFQILKLFSGLFSSFAIT